MSPLDFTILERLAVCRQGWFRTTHAVKFVMHHLMRHFKDSKVMGFRTGARSLENVARLHDKMLRGMMETPYDIDWHHCGSVELRFRGTAVPWNSGKRALVNCTLDRGVKEMFQQGPRRDVGLDSR